MINTVTTDHAEARRARRSSPGSRALIRHNALSRNVDVDAMRSRRRHAWRAAHNSTFFFPARARVGGDANVSPERSPSDLRLQSGAKALIHAAGRSQFDFHNSPAPLPPCAPYNFFMAALVHIGSSDLPAAPQYLVNALVKSAFDALLLAFFWASDFRPSSS